VILETAFGFGFENEFGHLSARYVVERYVDLDSTYMSLLVRVIENVPNYESRFVFEVLDQLLNCRSDFFRFSFCSCSRHIYFSPFESRFICVGIGCFLMADTNTKLFVYLCQLFVYA
jgi:hypothetical protein